MNNFNDIKLFLNERKQEINDMISLCKSSKVREAVLIKSSIVLLAYNTVEGCYTKLNEEVFSFIAENHIPINKLNTELQSVYYRYYKNTINDIESLKKFYENREITSITYDEICDKVTLFSGNLDARSIREFSNKQIGIKSISTSYGKQIVVIKNLRNKLAHGEITFQDAVKDKTLEEIESMSKDCIKFLEVVISSYEEFYINKIQILTC